MQRTGAGGLLARVFAHAPAAYCGKRCLCLTWLNEEGRRMLFLALFMLLIAIVIGLGFIVKTLFYVAILLGLICVIVFFWLNIRGHN